MEITRSISIRGKNEGDLELRIHTLRRAITARRGTVLTVDRAPGECSAWIQYHVPPLRFDDHDAASAGPEAE